jgi:hypothetical protein
MYSSLRKVVGWARALLGAGAAATERPRAFQERCGPEGETKAVSAICEARPGPFCGYDELTEVPVKWDVYCGAFRKPGLAETT